MTSMAQGGRTKNRYAMNATEIVHRVLDMERPNEKFAEIFKENFECNILDKPDENTLIFELIGIDVSVANALRRILLSEVTTMAIQTVYFHDNSSIVQDEVLAHRIGLVPLKVDPAHFHDIKDPNNDEKTDLNTLVYKLDVTCRRKKPGTDIYKAGPDGEETLDVDYTTLENGMVRSGDLQWVPQGTQEERLGGVPAKPVYDDIVLAKLRPGQRINLEVHAIRGIGKTHAKWSPVCTAHYRMMPEVKLVKEVYDEKAELLNELEPGVFDVIAATPAEKKKGHTKKAVLKATESDPYLGSRNCSMSRNYMRDEVLKESVVIQRVPDHFIFSIESVGQLPPDELFRRAVQVLKEKCSETIENLAGGGSAP